jgi:hypothetical protein
MEEAERDFFFWNEIEKEIRDLPEDSRNR